MEPDQQDTAGHFCFTVGQSAAGSRLDLWLQEKLNSNADHPIHVGQPPLSDQRPLSGQRPQTDHASRDSLALPERSSPGRISRTVAQRLIQGGYVTRASSSVDSQPVACSSSGSAGSDLAGSGSAGSAAGCLSKHHKVAFGERYIVAMPPSDRLLLSPVAMDLNILYEDRYLAVIEKPPGLTVHPGDHDSSITLVHGLIHRWPDLPGKLERPGIVHRLDRDTEGLLLVGKEEAAYQHLMDQFARRLVEKEYLAWLMATPRQSTGKIELPIARHPVDRLKMRVAEGGRQAVTYYQVIKTISSKNRRKFCQVSLHPYTGRTHQLRVHLAHQGCPVVGDLLYSRKARQFSRFGLMLLARRLAFRHPHSKEWIEFQINVTDRFQAFEQYCANL